jgi:hypothetical protein
MDPSRPSQSSSRAGAAQSIVSAPEVARRIRPVCYIAPSDHIIADFRRDVTRFIASRRRRRRLRLERARRAGRRS